MDTLQDILKETQEAQAGLKDADTLPEGSRPRQRRKREVLEKFISQGQLQVQVDSTLPGVDIPAYLLGGTVVLNFSHGFAVDDLKLTDRMLIQTLTFKGVRHWVRVPLKAILAARSVTTGEPAEFEVFTGEPYQDPPDSPGAV